MVLPTYRTIGKYCAAYARRGHRDMCRAEISRVVDSFFAMGWMDSIPIHLIATGMANFQMQLLCRVYGVPRRWTIPSAMYHYRRNIDGVDQSDFMRVARYSVEHSYHTWIWYTTIFQSLFDLAIANAYIFHNVACKMGHRADSMYSLAEKMVNYVHVDDIRGAKRRQAHTNSLLVPPLVTRSIGQYILMELCPGPQSRIQNMLVRQGPKTRNCFMTTLEINNSTRIALFGNRSKENASRQNTIATSAKPLCAQIPNSTRMLQLEKSCYLGTIYTMMKRLCVDLRWNCWSVLSRNAEQTRDLVSM